MSRREAVKKVLVNRHVLARNKKQGRSDPPLSVQQSGKRVRYAREVDILDARGEVVAVLVYRPTKPLSCGATVWIEARHGVRLHDETRAVACNAEEFGDTPPPPTLFDSLTAEADAPTA